MAILLAGNNTHRPRTEADEGKNMSRQVSQKERDWLEGEIAIWQTMGLVDEEQARAQLASTNRGIVRGTAANQGDCSRYSPWRRV